MNDSPPNDIDEVALNVLLAEGVDLPTALEASRRGAGEQDAVVGPGCLIGALILCVLFFALRLFF